MASPQLEDGYTAIANEILERLMMVHLSANQWQVLLCIIRKTYGFKKKVDYIANSQVQCSTNLGKTVVSRALAGLEDRGIITRTGKLTGIQKDWERWKVSNSVNFGKVSSLANSEAKVSNSANLGKLAILSTELAIPLTELAILSTKVSSPVVTQKKKETYTKETIQKKGYGEFQNVLLLDAEYQKLVTQFGEPKTLSTIERLSAYMESKGKRYKSHYATILNWQRRNGDVQKANPRGLPKVRTGTPDYPEFKG